MIRTPPQHNVKDPPGQIVAPTSALVSFEKPLQQLIQEYQQETLYKQGFDDGWKACERRFNRKENSEEAR
jgi:hypothetical protein